MLSLDRYWPFFFYILLFIMSMYSLYNQKEVPKLLKNKVYFIHHKIYSLHEYDSMIFNNFTKCHNHHHKSVFRAFLLPQ